MHRTILTIRIVFFLLMVGGSFLLAYTIPDWDDQRGWVVFGGACLGALVVLVDVMLKGFSLRGLSALTFGLFIGWLAAFFITESPLFEKGDPSMLFIARLVTFPVLMYLGTVIALRGKDEFNLVIPYIRFSPQQVDIPLAVVDTSALIDGRIVGICESKFMGYALVIPRFVIDELSQIADSKDPHRQARGRAGLDTLNRLRKLLHVDLRIHDSELGRGRGSEEKLVFVAQSLKAKLLTTDFNLAQVAEFHNVDWLNITTLARALNPEPVVGECFDISLIKHGKEQGQAVGFLNDGSMVVVNDGHTYIGQEVRVEIQSILPSAGGRLVFAKILHQNNGSLKNS